MEKPSKVEAGQRYRGKTGTVYTLVQRQSNAGTSGWQVSYDEAGGTVLGWLMDVTIERLTFLGGPSPAVSAGRPKPAKGQRWRSRWAFSRHDGHVQSVTMVTSGYTVTLNCETCGEADSVAMPVFERNDDEGCGNGWYEFVDHGEQPKVTAPVCKVPAKGQRYTAGDGSTAVLTEYADDMHWSVTWSDIGAISCYGTESFAAYASNFGLTPVDTPASRTEAKPEPTQTEFARGNKESVYVADSPSHGTIASFCMDCGWRETGPDRGTARAMADAHVGLCPKKIDPSIRKAAEAQRAKGPTFTVIDEVSHFDDTTWKQLRKLLPKRIVGVYTGSDQVDDRASRAAMDTAANGLGACLIDLEQPARVSAFTERFGKPTPSTRYKPSDDLDQDIPNSWEV